MPIPQVFFRASEPSTDHKGTTSVTQGLDCAPIIKGGGRHMYLPIELSSTTRR